MDQAVLSGIDLAELRSGDWTTSGKCPTLGIVFVLFFERKLRQFSIFCFRSSFNLVRRANVLDCF